MLATVIPYLLLAIVSDKSVWPNGPEFKFDSEVEIHVNGLNGTNLRHGFNITNDFTCRPKTTTSLQCRFQHKNMIAYEVNKETGQIKSREVVHPDPHIYDPFPFEIWFDKKGVNKIIMNETLSKCVAVLDVAKAMASALNVATDLSGVKLSADPVVLGQVRNIILGKCKGDVLANLEPSFEENSSKEADWKLELSPPLEKLGGKNLNVMKTWNMTDCETDNKVFWLGMFVALEYENRPHGDDVTVHLFNISDRITISRGSFYSLSTINMELNEKIMNIREVNGRRDYYKEEKKLGIQEFSGLRLSGVRPATDIWPEIENTVTIDLNNQE